ncbi:S4 domain-containing protein [Methanocella sp. MCL-LM]|uniref:S4 domain-containing protein n=1 Tax=Methanocella sp. MCL-LM TaxID=3412035 RepID=UPI003C75396F
MRLDEYLVEEGLIASRSRAKRYIHRGLVKMNSEVVTKPSKQVKPGAVIEIAEEDRPEGYFKLKGIQEQSDILHPGDRVLDIGSSAGGFLMYASGFAGEILGIEFSEEFREPLEAVVEEYPNVQVIFGDAFTIDLSQLGEFDVILNDMTVEPAMSIEIMARFLPLLHRGGRVLQVLKLDKISDIEPFLTLVESRGLDVVRVIRPEKREAYVIAASRRGE